MTTTDKKLIVECDPENNICCDSSDCQICCPHDERDHGICLYCGDESDMSGEADWAYEQLRDQE